MLLSARQIVTAWEQGRRQHPIDRALTLLACTGSGAGRGVLATLPLGERDARLLRIYRDTFGGALACFAECTRCGERLELELDAAAVAMGAGAGEGGREGTLEVGDLVLQLRPLDSLDLAAAAGCGTPEEAARVLARRCVQSASRAGAPVDAGEVADAHRAQIASRLVELDPGAEVLLDLRCPACDAAIAAPLDVAAFVWSKLSAAARRILREVHAIASAYGWSEEAILALGDARRQAYLELIHA